MSRNFQFLITGECNLSCKWCHQFCGTDLNREYSSSIMTVDQFRKYAKDVEKVIDSNSLIEIMGGEPTLHPKILNILESALEIIRPKLNRPIEILTNGFGVEVELVLKQIDSIFNCSFIGKDLDPSFCGDFRISASKNTLELQRKTNRDHYPIMRAAIDFYSIEEIEKQSLGCGHRIAQGDGVSAFGFYPDSVSVSIAKLFKLDVGLDHLPSLEETINQQKQLCKYCWIPCVNKTVEEVSPTVSEALEKWNKDPFFLKAK